MLDRIRSAFARNQKPVISSEDKDPRSGRIWIEEATDELVKLLTRIPETDELLTQAGIHRYQLSKLETDDEIFQALRTRREAVISTPWRLEGGEDKVQEFLYAELKPWIEVVVGTAWRAVPYGYSVMEVVYRQLEGRKIGIELIADKPIQWFDPQRNGDLKFFSPNGTDAAGVLVDQDFKFFLTVASPSYSQPKGEALLSRLYWPWFFRFNGWKFWGQFLERFGTPLLVGKSGNPTAMIKALIDLHQDAAIAVGKDDDVKVEQPGTDGEAFEKMENAIVRRYQRLILGQTLTSDTGKGGGGSYALGKVHAEVKEGLRSSDIRLVCQTAQKLVNALCVLNQFAGEVPQFVLADNAGLEAERSKRDTDLKNLGITLTRRYFEERYDLEPNDFLLPGESLGPHGEIIPPVVESSKGSGSVSDTALNGAQVASLLEIITAVVEKRMPVSTAKAVIGASFPEVSEAAINDMLQGLDTFKPVQALAKPAAKQPAGSQNEPEEPIQGGKAATGAQASRGSFSAASPKFTPGQEKVEQIGDELLGSGLQPLSSSMLKTVVLAATSPSDLERRLSQVLKVKDRSEFQMALEQALFMADVVGYANAERKL